MIVKGRYERSTIADILNPVNGYRGQLELCGQTPKDHRKDNFAFIKQKQEQLRQRMEEQARPKPEPFKLKKFTQVQSKVGLASAAAAAGLHIEPAESPSKIVRPSTAGRVRSNYGSQIAFGRTT